MYVYTDKMADHKHVDNFFSDVLATRLSPCRFRSQSTIDIYDTFSKAVDDGFGEPQISHFANFTPCEELVPKRHFWKM